MTLQPSGKAGQRYRCGACRRRFRRPYDDTKAIAELQTVMAPEVWQSAPGEDPAELAIICEDCFQGIMSRIRAEAPELLAKLPCCAEGACCCAQQDGGLGCWCQHAVLPGT